MFKIEDQGHYIDEETVKLFESFTDFNLTQGYRSFLLQYNGGRPVPNCFNFFSGEEGSSVNCFFSINRGNSNDLVKCIKNFSSRVPSESLPIGRDGFGNIICLILKGPNREQVYFWDHEFEKNDDEEPDYSNMTLIANSFDDFLDGLYELEV